MRQAHPDKPKPIVKKPKPVAAVQVKSPANKPTVKKRSGLRWVYGITTVPKRFNDLLPRTLDSLAKAGFDKPRLFVDGYKDPVDVEKRFGLPASVRWPLVKTFGNWVLSLWELYLRDPLADRYVLFQDDIIVYRNLKAYLESTPYPHEQAYCNLYTYPQNESKAPKKGYVGWYYSNQKGLGALALMFSRSAAIALLGSKHMAVRPTDLNRGWQAVDGAVVTALKKAGFREFVHMPSLCQHTGSGKSVMGHPRQPLAPSFKGENFDALNLLEKVRV